MLKLSVVLFAYLALVLAQDEEMQELLTQLHNSCRDETGAAEDILQDARKGTFADDDKLRCYMKCVMDQMAVISDDGIVDEDALIGLLPDDIKGFLEPGIRKCGTKIGVSPCDNAYKTFQCYYESDPVHYFLP